MATLTANKKIDYEFNEDPLLNDIPVVATDIVYEGAAVGESASTGTGRPLVSGDSFLGMAVAKCDNTTGAAGDKNIRVRQRGTMKVAVAIVAGIADLGANVYASDDDVFTLSSSHGFSPCCLRSPRPARGWRETCNLARRSACPPAPCSHPGAASRSWPLPAAGSTIRR